MPDLKHVYDCEIAALFALTFLLTNNCYNRLPIRHVERNEVQSKHLRERTPCKHRLYIAAHSLFPIKSLSRGSFDVAQDDVLGQSVAYYSIGFAKLCRMLFKCLLFQIVRLLCTRTNGTALGGEPAEPPSAVVGSVGTNIVMQNNFAVNTVFKYFLISFAKLKKSVDLTIALCYHNQALL